MADAPFRCGFVVVIGRPNVGKSTLINALVGAKVSIVTPKPQTTRHRILGVHTAPEHQTIFVDTPGMHQDSRKAMNRMMNRTAANALSDADLCLFVCEANRWTREDQASLDKVRKARLPTVAILNKTDKVHPKEMLLESIADLSGRHDFREVIPVSAKTGNNLDRLKSVIPEYLPESGPLFPAESTTDRDESFRIAELIREKLTLNLRQEVPYGLTVQIERLERDAGGVAINAIIWVERDSQKGIVVGKGGGLLKKVGRAARLELRDGYGCPVHIELWVKVKENWADNERELLRLGYE
ncbi:MAG: GTPase Era [Gammaproteobacteria bacterium]|nr:GTPase Era [Gammaproteobacteria bacterium]